MARGPKRHIPIRTCISCGDKRGKSEFIRLILDGNSVAIWDVSAKGQGRGAYVCRKKICVERLGKDRRLNRAFRKWGTLRVHPEVLTAADKAENNPAEISAHRLGRRH
jgi:predicted RNA-binding protein YlxR (DUF448 family)